MSDWQPIETAPRDRFILLWCPDDQSRWLAKWQSVEWYGVDDQGLTRSSVYWPPTQWQPLPEPPPLLVPVAGNDDKPRFDKRAYQREYMRKRRADQKAKG